MIASRAALDQLFVRNACTIGRHRLAVASTTHCITVRNKSTPVRGVNVEHGRGVWKTYGDLSNYKQGKYQIKTFNKISPVGLARFPSDEYDIREEGQPAANAHAILLRSHKLKEEEVPKTVRAIARYDDLLFSHCRFHRRFSPTSQISPMYHFCYLLLVRTQDVVRVQITSQLLA
jgi:hypothetical protein